VQSGLESSGKEDSYPPLFQVVWCVVFLKLYLGEVCGWEVFAAGAVEEFGFVEVEIHPPWLVSSCS